MQKAISFVEIKNNQKHDTRISWDIVQNDKSLGEVWLDLENNEYIDAPCIYARFEASTNDIIAKDALKHVMKYAYCNLPYDTIRARQPIKDEELNEIYKSLGFEKDGDEYQDTTGNLWQNVQLVL